MKNMCLTRLYLVNPLEFPHPDAEARASGAVDILDSAELCTSLQQAVSGCGLVIGASARIRRADWPQLDPKACAQLVATEGVDSNIAIVFGREHSGLNNQELDSCNYLLHIPCNEDFSSLNLGAAVQVISYELMMKSRDKEDLQEKRGEGDLATADEVEGFYQHMQEALIDAEFLNPENPRKLMRKLRRLYNRVRLEKVEISILRGILSAMQEGKRKTN
jgi:tRNA (cytidine32/uridine32-2'-O)-methyltransferase